jgi:hypothetical protein
MNIDDLKIGSKWLCKVKSSVFDVGGLNLVQLHTREEPTEKKYMKIIDIWGDVIKCDFDGLDAECTFENLLEYFEEVKEEI